MRSQYPLPPPSFRLEILEMFRPSPAVSSAAFVVPTIARQLLGNRLFYRSLGYSPNILSWENSLNFFWSRNSSSVIPQFHPVLVQRLSNIGVVDFNSFAGCESWEGLLEARTGSVVRLAVKWDDKSFLAFLCSPLVLEVTVRLLSSERSSNPTVSLDRAALLWIGSSDSFSISDMDKSMRCLIEDLRPAGIFWGL